MTQGHRDLLTKEFGVAKSAELIYVSPTDLYGPNSSVVLIHDYIEEGRLYLVDGDQAWELDIGESKAGSVATYLIAHDDFDRNGFSDYQIVVERYVGNQKRYIMTYMRFEGGGDVFFGGLMTWNSVIPLRSRGRYE